MAETRSTGATNLLTGLATLLLIVGVAFAVFILGGALLGIGNHDIAVHQSVRADHVERLPPDVLPPSSVPVTIRLRDASHRQLLLAAGRDAGPIVVTVAIVWLARGLLRSVRDGDPFTDRNVWRLRGIGFLFLFGLPAVALLNPVFEAALARSSPAGELGTSFSIPATGPLVGLGVFVLAEIFARGVGLRLDVEGTV